jgi:hypothetical protein
MVAIMGLTLSAMALGAEPDWVLDFKVREGALVNEPQKVRWKFRSDGKSETYDLSVKALLSGGPIGIPMLQEAGLKFEGGPAIFRGPSEPMRTLLEEAKSNLDPVMALIYAGAGGKLVCLNLRKPTKVFRVDTRISYGEDYSRLPNSDNFGERFTFWQNRNKEERLDERKPELSGTGRRFPFCDIDAAALELVPGTNRDFKFRSNGGKEEIFHDGIPGLNEIGFKLDNRVEFLYKTAAGARSESATIQAAAAKYPGHKPMSLEFLGQAKSRVEISLEGKTAVVRAALKFGAESYPENVAAQHDITLWANRKPEVSDK